MPHRLNYLCRIFILGFAISIRSGFAQEQIKGKQPITPVQEREADVMLSKRIWRVIDLRQKQNTEATWPKNPLVKILYEVVSSAKLKAYLNDSLSSTYNLEEFLQRGSNEVLVRKLIDPNSDDDRFTTDTVYEPFVPTERIKQILVLEDWLYDKKNSREFVRIIAIAPLFRLQVSGIDLGLQPLCWLKYYDRFQQEKSCRDVLSTQVMFNAMNSRSNDFSYDDWFEQRRFSSYIIKESNQYDISIMDDPEVKQNGIQALIQAARMKNEAYEKDANHYEE